MTTPFQYAEEHGNEFLEQLKDLLRIPSVSALSEHKPDMRRCAEWLKDHFLAIGLARAEIMETAGHPVVYAEWLGAGADKPTVLIYGHYDVQPVDDPRKEWLSKPFEPTERDGNLFARGATDDKGQTFVHLKAFEAIMKTTGSFPVNIKFMLEGEEEISSLHLEAFLKDHLDLLQCDVVVISDSDVLSPTQPMLTYGLRGLFYTEVEVFGPARDLHSGAYGGVVHNPAQALVEILAQLHDKDGRVTVPHFYHDVAPLTPADREAFASLPRGEADLLSETGASQLWGEPDFTALERIGARPTLEINGIVGGWTGEGAKTVIGARALAKVSCRLVGYQKPDVVFENFKKYIAELTPPTVRSEVRLISDLAPGVLIPIESPSMRLAAAAYEKTFGAKPVFARGGGSIPVVGMYQTMLNVPVLLMGFGLPDDNLHAPNEKFNIGMFHKGIQTMLHLFESLPTGLK